MIEESLDRFKRGDCKGRKREEQNSSKELRFVNLGKRES